MIVKRFKKIGKLSKPYYTQNNEQVINYGLGKIRRTIESKVGGKEPYDIYKIIADQAKRIDVLEALIKKLEPDSCLEPKLDIGKATEIYMDVNKRQKEISDILNKVKEV